MNTLFAILIFGLVYATIFSLLASYVWMRFRMIAVAVPEGSDPQARHFRLTESIRSSGYRADSGAVPSARFRAPAAMKWFVGLQDISVASAVSSAVLVTGPALHVSRIGRHYTGATRQPYKGRQPVWPLVKGFLRMMSIGAVFFASLIAVLVFSAR